MCVCVSVELDENKVNYAIRIDWIIWKMADPHTTNKNSANNHGPTGYWSSLFFYWKELKIRMSLICLPYNKKIQNKIQNYQIENRGKYLLRNENNTMITTIAGIQVYYLNHVSSRNIQNDKQKWRNFEISKKLCTLNSSRQQTLNKCFMAFVSSSRIFQNCAVLSSFNF